MASSKVVRVEVEVTKLWPSNTRAVVGIYPPISSGLVQSRDPHANPFRDLKGLSKLVTVKNGEKHVPITARIIGNNRALKGK